MTSICAKAQTCTPHKRSQPRSHAFTHLKTCLHLVPLHKTELFYDTMSATVKQLKLNTGASIPQIGFGTWLAKPGEVEKAVSSIRSEIHVC